MSVTLQSYMQLHCSRFCSTCSQATGTLEALKLPCSLLAATAMDLFGVAVAVAVVAVTACGLRMMELEIWSWQDEQYETRKPASFMELLEHLQYECSYLKGWMKTFVKFVVLQLWWVPAAVVLWRLAMQKELEFEPMVMEGVKLKAFVGALQFYARFLKGYEALKTIAEKCMYMERRLMQLNGRPADASRLVMQDMEAFCMKLAGEKNAGVMWLTRRLREHFSNWCSKQDAACTGLWSLVCSEVQLRYCRDCLAERHAAIMQKGLEIQQNGLQVIEESYIFAVKMASAHQVKVLQNLCRTVEFWTPLQPEEFEAETLEAWVDASSPWLEKVMKSQLLERKEELMNMFQEIFGEAGMEKMQSDGGEWLCGDMPQICSVWKQMAFMKGGGRCMDAGSTKK